MKTKQRTEIEILSDMENAETEIAVAIRYQDAARLKKWDAKLTQLGEELAEVRTPQLL